MFQDLLPKLDFSVSDLDTYHEANPFGLDPDQTRSIGYLKALVVYGHRKRSRTVKTTFKVVSLITPYHCVVGKPTLAKLGVVASAVHLRMKFHSLGGEVITIFADINSAERTQYLALKETRRHLQDAPEPTWASKHIFLTEVDARYDLESSEDEGDDELVGELKKKNKRPEPEREFIEVTLKDYQTKTVKLGSDFPEAV